VGIDDRRGDRESKEPITNPSIINKTAAPRLPESSALMLPTYPELSARLKQKTDNASTVSLLSSQEAMASGTIGLSERSSNGQDFLGYFISRRGAD